jgi:hypothetical protein
MLSQLGMLVASSSIGVTKWQVNCYDRRLRVSVDSFMHRTFTRRAFLTALICFFLLGAKKKLPPNVRLAPAPGLAPRVGLAPRG